MSRTPDSSARGRPTVLVAGATGAIGVPLTSALVAAGHDVVALARSPESAATLRAMGSGVVIADGSDPSTVRAAVREASPDVIVNHMTALPNNGMPTDDDHRRTRVLRTEATSAMLEAAPHARLIAQSVAFAAAPSPGSVVDEDAPLYLDAPGGLRAVVEGIHELEQAVTASAGVVLRLGFLYGPGTWYHAAGAAAAQLRRGALPVVGSGQGLWSWLHVADAVTATMAAFDAPAGIYHVSDNAPAPMAEWVPAAAAALGAPEPQRVEGEKLAALPPELRYFGELLPGADNHRFRSAVGWSPAYPTWQVGHLEAWTGARPDSEPDVA